MAEEKKVDFFELEGCGLKDDSRVDVRRPETKELPFTAVLTQTHATLHNPACTLVREATRAPKLEVKDTALTVTIEQFDTYRKAMQYIFSTRGQLYPVTYCRQDTCAGKQGTAWDRLPVGVNACTGLSTMDVWDIQHPSPTFEDQPMGICIFDVENSATVVPGVGYTNRRIREITVRRLVNPSDGSKPWSRTWKFKSGKYNKNSPTFEVALPDLVAELNKLIPENKSKQPGYLGLIAHNGKAHDVVLLRKEFKLVNVAIPKNWLFADSLCVAKQLFFSCKDPIMPQSRGLSDLMRSYWATVITPMSMQHSLAVSEMTRDTSKNMGGAKHGLHTSDFDTTIQRDLLLLWLNWVRHGDKSWADALERLRTTWKSAVPITKCHISATADDEKMLRQLFARFDAWLTSDEVPPSPMDLGAETVPKAQLPKAAPPGGPAPPPIRLLDIADQVAVFPGSHHKVKVFHHCNKGCVKKAKVGAHIVYMTKDEAIKAGYKPCGKCRP